MEHSIRLHIVLLPVKRLESATYIQALFASQTSQLPLEIHQGCTPHRPMQPSSNRHQKFIYLRLLSYMLLDWAQILKGSGFLWVVPSPWESWEGRPGKGCEGAGGVLLSLRGAAREECTGESVWVLRWLETLCWELLWLSFLDNCCRGSRSI